MRALFLCATCASAAVATIAGGMRMCVLFVTGRAFLVVIASDNTNQEARRTWTWSWLCSLYTHRTLHSTERRQWHRTISNCSWKMMNKQNFVPFISLRCDAVTRRPFMNYLYSISFSCPLFSGPVPHQPTSSAYFSAISHFCHRQQCAGAVQRAQNFASFELNKVDTWMKEKAKAVYVCYVQLYVQMYVSWISVRYYNTELPVQNELKVIGSRTNTSNARNDGDDDEDDFQLPTFELEIEVDKSPPSHKYWFSACSFTAQMG